MTAALDLSVIIVTPTQTIIIAGVGATRIFTAAAFLNSNPS
jgi:hypothetical protein